MSRNTVERRLSLDEPPRYERPVKGSAVDLFMAEIVARLEQNPKVAATVIFERLRLY